MRKSDPDLRAVNTKPQRPAPPSVGKVAARVAKKFLETAGRAAPSVTEDWAGVVGPDLAPHCRPGAITGSGKARSLLIEAYSGPAAARIQFMGDIITARLRERLGAKAPRRVRVRLAAPPDLNTSEARAAAGLPQAPRPPAKPDTLDTALDTFAKAYGRRS